MSRELVISGLLIILAFIAAFASLAFAPEEVIPDATAAEAQAVAEIEQLLDIKLL